MSSWITPPEQLAAYATRSDASRGRLYQEPESRERTPYRRDCDRVLHSGAFRRLKYKTQVFVDAVGQNYRTRLTHSLEVSQIARAIARRLGLNEDLSEALALSHDLGHTCFGHAGEDALKECMEPYGGFDHNAQALKVVTVLEHRYAAFDGLNMTWETLEGLVKHNGPLEGPLAKAGVTVPPYVRTFNAIFDLDLASFAGPEAQAAAIADDIAYNAHDLDDGLRAHFVELDQVVAVPMVGDILREVMANYPGISRSRLIHEVVRRLIGLMIQDVYQESSTRLEPMSSVSDVRAANAPVIAFSESMAADIHELGSFLFETLYRHYRVNRMTSKSRLVVRNLFRRFVDEPRILPEKWRQLAEPCDDAERARVVCDYIAGMTDHFALDEHARLFDPLVKP